MTSSARISVLLPTYNRAHLLGETLESLRQQTRRPDQILVIDDGSTDSTRELIETLEQDVEYVRQENSGKSGALNRGLSMAVGDLIWICDDDDLLLPRACEALAGALESDKTLGFAAGRFLDFQDHSDSGEREFSEPGYSPRSSPDEIFPDLLEGCHIFQPGLMVRREVYERAGSFDPDRVRAQDYDMLLRIARRNRGILLEEIVFHHRVHSGARGNASSRFGWSEANAVWIEHHKEIFSSLVPKLDDAELLSDRERDGLSSERLACRALLKRATVYGRAQLWSEAIEIWRAVARRLDLALTPDDTATIRRATGHAFGCSALVQDPAMMRSISELARISSLGAEIARQVRASLKWRMRRAATQGNVPEVVRLGRFMATAR